MRLNETEKKVLIDAIHAQDPSASVWLFGSRVDDQKKGGLFDAVLQLTPLLLATAQRIENYCDRYLRGQDGRGPQAHDH